MAEQEPGVEPPNKRPKMEYAAAAVSTADEFAALLENELPDDLMDQWGGDSTHTTSNASGTSAPDGTTGVGVNGVIEASGGGPGTGNPSDRPQQLTSLLRNRPPTQSIGPMVSQGPNTISQGPHSISSQGSILGAVTNSKSPHGGPLQSMQSPTLNKPVVQTSISLSMNEPISMNSIPSTLTNSLSGGVAASLPSISSSAPSLNLNTATNTSIGIGSIGNTVPSSIPGGNIGGMNVANMGTLSTVTSMNSVNKLQGVMTSMNPNLSGPIGGQMNDGIPNGPLPGISRPMMAGAPRGQIAQSLVPNPQGIPRHPGMGPVAMRSKLQVRRNPVVGGMGQQPMPTNYGFPSVQQGIDNMGQPNSNLAGGQRTMAMGGIPPRYSNQEMGLIRGNAVPPNSTASVVQSLQTGPPVGPHSSVPSQQQAQGGNTGIGGPSVSVGPNSASGGVNPVGTIGQAITAIPSGTVGQPPAGNQMTPQGQLGQARPSAADPEKRKLIQQQLVLLLHAHKCQRRESQANGEVKQCNLPHCQTMKNVLTHMANCHAGRSCCMPHCASSRQIISHWKHCRREDCPVCEPLKQAERNKVQSSQPSPLVTPSQPGQQVVSQLPQQIQGQNVNQPANTGSVPVSSSPGVADANIGRTVVPGAGNVLGPVIRPGLPKGPDGTALGASPSQGISAGNVMVQPPNAGHPRGINPSVGAVNQHQFIKGPPNVTMNQANTVSATENWLSMPNHQLPLNVGLVTAKSSEGTKEWHQTVTTELRNHLVQKLVQAILPTPEPLQMEDKRMQNLISYATKVEGDTFAMANTRAEYYHLLAEKIYKIQKELEEKRLLRRQGPRDGTIQVQAGVVQVSESQTSMSASPYMQGGLRMPLNSVGKPGSDHQIGSRLVSSVGGQTVSIMRPQTAVCSTGSLNASYTMNSSTIGPVTSCTVATTSSAMTPPNQIFLSSATSVPSDPSAGIMPGIRTAAPPPYSASGEKMLGNSTASSNIVVSMGSIPMSIPPQSTSESMSISSISGISSMENSFSSQQLVPHSITTSANIENNVIPTSVHTNELGLTSSIGKSVTTALAESKNERAFHIKSEPMESGMAVDTQLDSMETVHAEIKVERKSEVVTGIKCEVKQEVKEEAVEDPSTQDIRMVDDGKDGMLVKSESLSPQAPGEMLSKGSGMKTINNSVGATNSTTTLTGTCEPSSEFSGSTMDSSSVAVKSENTEVELNTANSETSTPVMAPVVTPSTPKKERPPLFRPDELRQHLYPTLEKLFRQDPESIPFKQPVDPQALGIPDYFDIIKKPMDLSTIKKKLDSGQYTDPWDYVDDVWLMFDNAWIYNRKTSRVYRYCTKLAEVFEQEIDPVMQQLGYCCGRKYTFNPQVLCCYGKQLCTIPREAKYYSYQRYSYCYKCFHDIQGETVTLGDDPSQPTLTIKKSQFQELKNDALDLEPLVECSECGRKQHQICVLYMEAIWPQGYTCDGCLKKKGLKRKENKYISKRLPTTKLSNYLETRVNNFLKKKEAGAGEVYIRVVSSTDKMVEVKPGMKARFVDSGQLPPDFPYRAKALFAFEEIDGVDVCFFGMHVQEYGSDSKPPNTRRVYLAYLDSVHFFRPRHYRTSVYYEILLGYLDYVKQLGYTMAHIWACPPSEGDDYIFHCHPPDQKIPKPKRLQDWYKRMLDKGIVERIVLDYKDIHKQAFEDNMKSPAELPYFEGDFWPNVMEESIKELDQEEEEKRKQEEAAAAAAEAAQGNEEEEETSQDGKKKGQKKHKTKTKSKNPQKNKSKSKSNSSGCNDLAQKIFATMEKHKDVFFVIRLHSAQSAVSLPPIQDPDPIMVCDLMDGRDAFLTLASERHLEFSSLRRAKYSTMVMLYELHNQGQDKFVYTCNHCKTPVETRYHCQECDDFDLCTSCFNKEGHPHKMIKLGLDLEDGSGASNTDNKNLNPQEARKKSIQRCIQSVVHAAQCRDANCRLPSCQKMKRVLNHAKACKKKNNGGCSVCKQLIALCYYHARGCKDPRCVIIYCYNIKAKLKQQEVQQRFQQQQLMRRRMLQMNARMVSSQSSSSTTVPQPVQSPVQNSPAGMKPVAQGPSPKVLEVVKEVQRQAAQQAGPVAAAVTFGGKGGNTGNMPVISQSQIISHMNAQQIRPAVSNNQIGGVVPQVSQISPMGKPNAMIHHQQPAVTNQQQVNQQQNRTLPGMEQLWNRYPSPGGIPGQQQSQPGTVCTPMISQQSTMPQQPNQQVMGPPGQPGQPVQQQGQPQRNATQALQHLLQTLRNPSSHQQQMEVLQILKTHPQLMAAFIRQRQILQQNQQQQQQQKQQQQQSPSQQGPGCQPTMIPQGPQGPSGMQSAMQPNMGHGIQGNIPPNMQPTTIQTTMQGAMVSQMNTAQSLQGQQQIGVSPSQNVLQQQQWYNQQKQQQQLILRQQQQSQQQGGFQQPQTPMFAQRRTLGFPQQHNFQAGDNQFSQNYNTQQQMLMQQQQMKPVAPSMSPQPGGPGMLSHAGMANPSPQQLMQSVTSPPPNLPPQAVRSPQPNPSPRNHQPIPSPRSGPVPSPHHPAPVHSPHPGSQSGPSIASVSGPGGANETMMLSQMAGHHPGQGMGQLQPANNQLMGGLVATSEGDVPSMTREDQLSKLAETL